MKTTEHTEIDYVIETPYIGYSTVSDVGYPRNITSCGACVVCMILSLHQIPVDPKKFIEQGHQNGGYTTNGWSHIYLVNKLQESNFSYVKLENCPIELSFKQITKSILEDNPVIVSVNKFCLEQNSFHMVLIVGIKTNPDKSILGFFYHDPAAITQEKGLYRYVTVENFIQFWRKKMIIKI